LREQAEFGATILDGVFASPVPTQVASRAESLGNPQLAALLGDLSICLSECALGLRSHIRPAGIIGGIDRGQLLFDLRKQGRLPLGNTGLGHLLDSAAVRHQIVAFPVRDAVAHVLLSSG
jgi:hypothetical protein